jgi:hypothetical protein
MLDWLLVLAVQMLVTRVPFLLHRDVMFVGVGLALLPALPGSAAAIAAMFVAMAAVNLSLHAAALGLAALVAAEHDEPAAEALAKKAP